MGNKAELTNQKVISKQQGEEFAKSNNLTFFETSAKTGQGIDEAF